MAVPTLRETAIHEAGHAVIARLLGASVTHIEITPDETSRGRDHIAQRTPLSQTDWAAVCYAGLAAEHRLNPECNVGLADSDMRQFYAALKGASDATRISVMRWTNTAVATHWDEVEKLAAELVRCNGLYTDELERLDYWWPKSVGNSALMAVRRGRAPVVPPFG